MVVGDFMVKEKHKHRVCITLVTLPTMQTVKIPAANRFSSTQGRATVRVGTMAIRKHIRLLVLLLMTATFLCMLGKIISEWSKNDLGETQNTKSASQIVLPSVTMFPLFETNFSLAKLSSFKTRKNLTEYNLKTSHIHKDILSIKQINNG